MEGLYIHGREADGTPIVLALPGDGLIYRQAYRRASEIARKAEFEQPGWLENFLRMYDSEVKKRNPLLKFLGWLDETILPNPEILAFRDVLKQSKR